MEVTTTTLRRFLELAAQQISARRDELTQLDAPIGDADHGANLDRGFTAVMARVAGSEELDTGALLKLVGTTLVSTVGGSSGPLYGTFFIRAGAHLAGQELVAPETLAEALAAGLAGVMARGRAQPGEKTMVDALAPAIEALQTALAAGADLPEGLRHAAEAAEAGMRATIPMRATKGRASYLGERSIGHQDPGATSACYLVQALRDAVCGGSVSE